MPSPCIDNLCNFTREPFAVRHGWISFYSLRTGLTMISLRSFSTCFPLQPSGGLALSTVLKPGNREIFSVSFGDG